MLEILLGGNPRSKTFLNLVIERCRKKLALWKANYLSIGGRITMTKAALSNLPIYFLSIFRIPRRVVVDIERMQCDFLWKGKEFSKPHLINWKIVSLPKK